MTVGTFEAS